jgi:hypothetical protein
MGGGGGGKGKRRPRPSTACDWSGCCPRDDASRRRGRARRRSPRLLPAGALVLVLLLAAGGVRKSQSFLSSLPSSAVGPRYYPGVGAPAQQQQGQAPPKPYRSMLEPTSTAGAVVRSSLRRHLVVTKALPALFVEAVELAILEGEVILMRMQKTFMSVGMRVIGMPLLALFESGRVRFAICASLVISLLWVFTMRSLSTLADRHSRLTAKGLYLRQRPSPQCLRCSGFGIERCDLCGGTGQWVYEKKFVYRDPCPKCLARRWVWCERCGGSGSMTRPWSAWALQRLLYTLFPG